MNRSDHRFILYVSSDLTNMYNKNINGGTHSAVISSPTVAVFIFL